MLPSEHTFATGHGIIIAGLPRSGTVSLTVALEELGYSRIHHCIKFPPDHKSWKQWWRASWATRPWLRRSYNHTAPWAIRDAAPGGGGWTRDDWNELIGNDYQVISDLGGYFGEQLMATYPDARVIILQRDAEAWARSYKGLVIPHATGRQIRILAWINYLTGCHKYSMLWDCMRNFFETSDPTEMRRQAVGRYKALHDSMRRITPKEQLLEFSLDEGWGPLCKFLDKPVPKTPFPRRNDREAYSAYRDRSRKLVLWKLGVVVMQILGSAVLAWVAVRYRTQLSGVVASIRHLV